MNITKYAIIKVYLQKKGMLISALKDIKKYQEEIGRALSQAFPDNVDIVDTIKLEKLTGGASGETLYKFQVDNSSFVLKVVNYSAQLPFKYFKLAEAVKLAEISANRYLSLHNLGPQLIYPPPDTKSIVMISEFIQGRTLTRGDFENSDMRHDIISRLRELHRVHISDQTIHDWNIVKRCAFSLERLTDQCHHRDCHFSEKTAHMFSGLRETLNAMEQQLNNDMRTLDIKPSLCHGDMGLGNMMLSNTNNRLYFIDCNDVSYSDRYFDVARLSVSLGLNIEQTSNLLQEYCENEPTKEQINHIRLLYALEFLRTGIWLLTDCLPSKVDHFNLPNIPAMSDIPISDKPTRENNEQKLRYASAYINEFFKILSEPTLSSLLKDKQAQMPSPRRPGEE